MRRPRDSQKSKVYNWEKSDVWPVEDIERWENGKPLLTLQECEDIVNIIWSDYGRTAKLRSDPPTVEHKRGSRSEGGRQEINMSKNCRFPAIVLHELSHSLQGCRLLRPNISHPAWHGPEFVRLYIDLLARYTHADPDMLISTALVFKIDVAGLDEIPKPRRTTPLPEELLSRGRY